MPDPTPAFLVAVAFDGTIVRPKRYATDFAEVPGALDFLAWLASNDFGM